MSKRSGSRSMASMDAKQVLVSFSKRRKGLFQKASDLCNKCDAQIAVLVVSPAGNPFGFGHSSVEQVLRRAAPRLGLPPGIVTRERRGLQAGEVEGLRGGVKREEKEELQRKVLSDVEARIERALEDCQTLEELEFLKMKCLALSQKIAEQLRNDQEGEGMGFDNEVSDFARLFKDDDDTLGRGRDKLMGGGLQNDMSYSGDKACVHCSESKNDVMFFPEKIAYSGGGPPMAAGDQRNENDMSLSSSNVGTVSDDYVFDFLGQVSDFWDQLE